MADWVARTGGRYSYRLLECRKHPADGNQSELLGVSIDAPILSIRCLHLSDDIAFQLEERMVNVEAAPGMVCRTLRTEPPSRWLVGHVPWTEAEHRIAAHEATAKVAAELGIRTRAACLVVERRTWNNAMPVTHVRLWHPGARHSLFGHFKPTQ